MKIYIKKVRRDSGGRERVAPCRPLGSHLRPPCSSPVLSNERRGACRPAPPPVNDRGQSVGYVKLVLLGGLPLVLLKHVYEVTRAAEPQCVAYPGHRVLRIGKKIAGPNHTLP